MSEQDEEFHAVTVKGEAYKQLANSEGFRLLLIRLEIEAATAMKALRTPYLEDDSMRETVIVWREWERMIDVIKNEVFSAIAEAEELTMGGTDNAK
jgi:hypothetical protein